MSTTATPTTPQPVNNDLWLDDQFAPLDMRGSNASLLNDLTEGAPIPDEDEDPPADPGAAAVAAAQPTPAPPQPAQPEVVTNEDGSSITIEKTSKGWKATLDANTGAQPEVFFGKTKDEMWQNVAVGKINATRKIRELNRRTKLGLDARITPAPASAPDPAIPEARELTADEIFEIKTDLQANPALAENKSWQKQYGLTPKQLVQIVTQLQREVRDTRAELLDTVAKAEADEFVRTHPDFAAIAALKNKTSYDNFEAVLGYLTRQYLGKDLASIPPNPAKRETRNDVAIQTLAQSGNWTAETLDEAYQYLKDEGLLTLEVAEPETEPVPPAPATPPTAQPSAPPTTAGTGPQRIAAVVRRPRAGLGIRPSDSIPSRQPSNEPPSAEQLDDLTDEQIDQLLAGVRRLKLGTAGRVPTR